MKRVLAKIFLFFFLVVKIHTGAHAQQDDNAEPNENSGGIIERYGRNVANSLDSINADPDTNPLLRNYSSVSDELLQNPPDADWLTWRRTYNNLGFSNLD